MDLDRIGREQYERAYLLKRFAQAGIAIYEYLTRAPVRLETPTDKFLVSASGFAAEVKRNRYACKRSAWASHSRIKRAYAS
jgi:hypothetical protein